MAQIHIDTRYNTAQNVTEEEYYDVTGSRKAVVLSSPQIYVTASLGRAGQEVTRTAEDPMCIYDKRRCLEPLSDVRHKARSPVNEHGAHAEGAGYCACVLTPGAAETGQRVMRGVVTPSLGRKTSSHS